MQRVVGSRSKMIENFVSLLFGVVEILFFSGIGFGFPFLQYVLEKELVFYDEMCTDESAPANVTEVVLCQGAKQQYNTIFTAAVVSNVCRSYSHTGCESYRV